MARLSYVFRIANKCRKHRENSFFPTSLPTLITEERGVHVLKCTMTIWEKWEGEDLWE